MTTGHRCPTCGEDFSSRRGLGVHHGVVHDERLPNRTCDECGDEFYSDYEKRYCSDDCLERAAPYAGENNPNYRGGKEATECELCGTAFEYYSSDKSGRYCSGCVETGAWRDPPSLEGEDNPRWKGGRIALTCEVCEKTVKRYPSELTGEVALCGESCRAEWLSETFTGEGHPNWKGGGNEAYGEGWSRTRKRALERDGHQCVICGTAKPELGRNPDVHHITPVRAFVESDRHEKTDAHTLDNVVSLCPDCHRKADFGKISKSRLRFLATSERNRPGA